jgi:hypothetical protein
MPQIEVAEARALSRSPDMMDLLQLAISKESAIDVIERLGALQREQRDHMAMVEFNQAMHRCQEKMKPIAARTQGEKGKYANYHDIDKIMRPIYTGDGFSLSYSEADCPIPQYIRLVCYVSHVGGHTRTYQKDWPIVTKGPKGNDVMTPTHAHGSADSYAKRYLFKDIFNVNVGEEDNDGASTGLASDHRNGGPCECAQCAHLSLIGGAHDDADLSSEYRSAFLAAEKINDWVSIEKFKAAKDARKKELTAKGSA